MRRNNTIRWILIIAAVAASLYYIYPTIQMETMSDQDRQSLADQGTLIDLEKKAIKRGLDLQGGMHLVLEVNLSRLFENLAQNKDTRFESFLANLQEKTAVYDADFYSELDDLIQSEGIALDRYYSEERRGGKPLREYLEEQAEDGVARTLEILRNRVDQFGVAEPSIQKVGSQRIIVELPGVQDVTRARELIGRTALLEFKLLRSSDNTSQTLDRINSAMRRKDNATSDDADIDGEEHPDGEDGDAEGETHAEGDDDAAVDAEETVSVDDLFADDSEADSADAAAAEGDAAFGDNPFYSLLVDLRALQGEVGVPAKNVFAVQKVLDDPDIQRLIPSDSEFLWGNEPRLGPTGEEFFELYHVNKEPELTGRYITDAQVDIGSGYSVSSAGQPIVNMTMDREGARIWSRVTGAHIEDRIAIVMDDKIFSAPSIRSKIPDGRTVIEGMANMEEAQDLSIVLRAGALPAPVEIIEERTVGPSLGSDSVRQSTWAMVTGFVLVVVFVLIYYQLSGLVALVALSLNVLFIFAVLAGFHATLTLPGVAGIILTIGMAIDANVLIFERIREELRTGKTIRACIDAGYDRAIRTILDANITTLIAAIVLYQFGTGPIRGFALTLAIGIVSSMFTAILVTHVVFDFVSQRWSLKKLSI
jgi:SecD/SecF fusion protein